MRGFRGSRSAQNQISSRFGKHQSFQNANERSFDSSQSDPQARLKALPDWVKTPETRAMEKSLAAPPKLALVRNEPVAAAKPKRKAPAVKAKGQVKAKTKPGAKSKAKPMRKSA